MLCLRTNEVGESMMLALSLIQPWAQLMADGRKHIETRSWAANPGMLKVGDLYVICASAKMTGDDQWTALEFGYTPETTPKFTLGAALCVVRHKGCYPTDVIVQAEKFTDEEESYGNYEPGRWGWMTELVHTLAEPIPVKGKLGLYPLPVDVEARIVQEMGVAA